MSGNEFKLGDVIDDYCSRCKLIMNHGVVSLVDGAVKRVRCNTCMNEHAYRQAKVPRKKKDSTQELFDQVLARIPEPKAPPQAQPKPVRRKTPHLRDWSGGESPPAAEEEVRKKKRSRGRGRKRRR